MGKGGVYYRKRIGGPFGQATNANFQNSQQCSNAKAQHDWYEVAGADVSRLVDEKTAESISALNATISQPEYYWIPLLAAVVGALLIFSVSPVMAVTAFGSLAFVSFLTKEADDRRRIYPLHYQFDQDGRNRYIALCQAVAGLSKASRISRIAASASTDDWKRNAGAGRIVEPIPVKIGQLQPPLTMTNVEPVAIESRGRSLYFMPDHILVYDGVNYGSVDYRDLLCTISIVSYREEIFVPSDTTVIGRTWLYVNKDGSPDRRFSYNKEIPIVEYAIIHLQSSQGLDLQYMVSSVVKAKQFEQDFSQAVRAPEFREDSQRTSGKGPYSGGQGAGRQSEPTDQGKTEREPVKNSDLRECCDILDIDPNCGPEIAAKAYRVLVKRYHPDAVHHLGPEFREVAELKMREINRAYDQLLKIKGW